MTRNGEAGPKAGPIRCTAILAPAGDRDNHELAARIANLAWAMHQLRGDHRTNLRRIKALQASGALHDEAYFGRLAGGAA